MAGTRHHDSAVDRIKQRVEEKAARRAAAKAAKRARRRAGVVAELAEARLHRLAS